jgi:hypothetical protein
LGLAQPTRWFGVLMWIAIVLPACAMGATCDEAVLVGLEEAGVARSIYSLFSLASVVPPGGQPGFTATVLEPMWLPRRACILDVRLQRSRTVASLQASVALLIAKVGPEIAELLGEQNLAIVVKTGLYGTPHGYYVLEPEDLAAGVLPEYSTYTADEREVVTWMQEFRKFLAEIAPVEPTNAREEYVPGLGAFVALSHDVISASAVLELGTCAAWTDLLLGDEVRGVGQIVAERVRADEVLVVEALLASYTKVHFVIPAAEYSDASGWEIYVE